MWILNTGVGIWSRFTTTPLDKLDMDLFCIFQLVTASPQALHHPHHATKSPPGQVLIDPRDLEFGVVHGIYWELWDQFESLEVCSMMKYHQIMRLNNLRVSMISITLIIWWDFKYDLWNPGLRLDSDSISHLGRIAAFAHVPGHVQQHLWAEDKNIDKRRESLRLWHFELKHPTYPLVIWDIYGKSLCYQWENPLKMAMFNSYVKWV